MKEDQKKEQQEYKKQLALIKEQYEEMLLKEEAKRKEKKVAPNDSYVSLVNINKVYDNYVHAVYDFNLDIEKKEFIVFVGPSGCGKSTTLRMIAGLEDITTGDLFIDGEYCNEKSAKERDIAMVFQNYALYPHMNVYQNMAFGLETRGYKKDDIDVAVKRAANILQINDLLERKPKELSGGQMQRVALGRAIVREAKVFLMDEPLSNLDAKLRVQMRSEIIKLHKEINATTIYVTHDQTEAMTMADRIVVMKDGFIQQIGSPEEVYNHPANQFVATFIGVPPMNLVEVTYLKGTLKFDDGYTIKLSKEEIKAHDNFYKDCIRELEKQIEEKVYERPDLHMLLTYEKEKFSLKSLFRPKKRQHIKTADEKHEEMLALLEEYKKCLKENHRIVFGIRPEDIHENIELPTSVIKSSPIKSKVGICELLGAEYHVYLPIWNKEIIAKIQANKSIKSGHTIELVLNMEKIHLFDENNGRVIF